MFAAMLRAMKRPPQPAAGSTEREWQTRPASTRHAYEQNRERIAAILAQTQAIKPNDPADTYLRQQGAWQPAMPAALRFHPALEWWEVDARGLALCRGRFPALVATLQNEVFPHGMHRPAALHTVALQRIYLPAQASAHRAATPAFIKTTGTTGDSRGAAVRLAPPEFIAGELTLGVAVGVINALRSARELRMPVWAVADLAALAHFRWPRGLGRLHVLADHLDHIAVRELTRKAFMCGLRVTEQQQPAAPGAET